MDDLFNIFFSTTLAKQPFADLKTFGAGEFIYDPADFVAYIHDNETPGGNPLQIYPENVINLATWLQSWFYTETEVNSLISDMATQTWVNNQGFLTSYTETDPVFIAHAAYGITSGKITNWDTGYSWGNHASAGYLVSSDLTGYATQTWVNSQGYLTGLPSHTHDDRYYTESEVNSLISGYATQTWVNAQGFLTSLPSHTHNYIDNADDAVKYNHLDPNVITSQLEGSEYDISGSDVFMYADVTFPRLQKITFQNHRDWIQTNLSVFSDGYTGFVPAGSYLGSSYFLNASGGWSIPASGGTGTVTSVALSSSDFSISGSPITTSGTITLNLAAAAVDAANLNNNVISGQTALTSGLASSDELFVSDNGYLKKMDVSVLQTYMQNSLTFGSGTPGGSERCIQYYSSGDFGGDANFTWDSANYYLNIKGDNGTIRIYDTSSETNFGEIQATTAGVDSLNIGLRNSSTYLSRIAFQNNLIDIQHPVNLGQAINLDFEEWGSSSTLDSTNRVIRVTASGVTVTFPSASGLYGRVYTIITSSYTVSLSSTSNIYNLNSSTISSIGTSSSMTFISTGTYWRRMI